jgi:hypothetical protein
MSDSENFLGRWSRRKREVANADKDANPARDREPAPDGESASESAPAAKTPQPQSPRPDKVEAAFDPTSLPSIESITAETDIRAFFAPGVPAELTRAALRRAWSADPQIRDFIGLEDYAWDFNAPESIPGFGPLEMTDELRREVARIVGDLVPETEPVQEADAQTPAQATQPAEPSEQNQSDQPPVQDDAAPTPVESTATTEESGTREPSLASPQDHIAMQQDISRRENLQPLSKRPHGRAIPK